MIETLILCLLQSPSDPIFFMGHSRWIGVLKGKSFKQRAQDLSSGDDVRNGVTWMRDGFFHCAKDEHSQPVTYNRDLAEPKFFSAQPTLRDAMRFFDGRVLIRTYGGATTVHLRMPHGVKTVELRGWTALTLVADRHSVLLTAGHEAADAKDSQVRFIRILSTGKWKETQVTGYWTGSGTLARDGSPVLSALRPAQSKREEVTDIYRWPGSQIEKVRSLAGYWQALDLRGTTITGICQPVGYGGAYTKTDGKHTQTGPDGIDAAYPCWLDFCWMRS